jgi:hypothetical protein
LKKVDVFSSIPLMAKGSAEIPPFPPFEKGGRRGDLRMLLLIQLFHSAIRIPNFDDLVKSQKGRHSRAGGSPELLDLTGFPLSRE